MAGYDGILKKESKPYLESLRDDMAARKDPDFFWPTGTQVYCGQQGSGKTISAVKHLLKLKERYPKALVVSNLSLNYLKPVRFKAAEALKLVLESLDPAEQYVLFDNIDELAVALTNVNNGRLGVIYVVDEIHTYFNALESKNIPMYVFTEISQQRKQRKLIIGTSQLFMRMAKPLREQCDNIIICNTVGGVLTVQKMYDGMSIEQDYQGNLIGKHRKTGWFFQNRHIRGAFDTFQKVISSQAQHEFEQINRVELVGTKKNRKFGLR